MVFEKILCYKEVRVSPLHCPKLWTLMYFRLNQNVLSTVASCCQLTPDSVNSSWPSLSQSVMSVATISQAFVIDSNTSGRNCEIIYEASRGFSATAEYVYDTGFDPWLWCSNAVVMIPVSQVSFAVADQQIQATSPWAPICVQHWQDDEPKVVLGVGAGGGRPSRNGVRGITPGTFWKFFHAKRCKPCILWNICAIIGP